LLETCQEIFDGLDQFEMAVSDLKGLKQGKLRLAVITTAKYFIPRILGAFCQQYPGIDVSLKVTNHQQIQHRMQDNKDDLYIISQPPEGLDLDSRPFLDNPLVVIARRDHPLAALPFVPLERLNNEFFIMREQGSGTRQAVQNLFNRQNVQVQVRLELGSNEAIKQAIAGGMGISVLSQHTLTSESYQSELVVLNVEHFPIKRRWYVATLAGKQLSIIAQTFLDYLLAESQTIAVHKNQLSVAVSS
ncbi:MAG: LysR substrate-binding domain-containing protein, partial [Microcystaceae cyanobacterium]